MHVIIIKMDLKHSKKKLIVPTLFIFGELDKMVNLEKGKKFAALIPNSKHR